MSDIWTPGSKPSEQPSGGIELPKGFARRRSEEETRQPAEPAAPESPAPEAPAAPSQAQRGRRSEFLFPPAGVQVQCPNCGTPFTAAVFSIVDLGANPELRQALLGNQINVASCPNCGAGGPLSAPLMVHDPENEFLGVLVPSQAGIQDMQIQKVIGEMSQALMRQLPNEARRGYMLNPKQYFDWDSFLEQFWGFEGVTPEELRRQREQGELMESLVRLANDETAMRMVLERRQHLVDENLFALLGQVMQAYAAQRQEENLNALRNVRQHLLDTTEAGAKVKALETKMREALGRVRPGMNREELLDILLEYWSTGEEGERIVATIVSMTRGLVDYEFLMTVAGRLEKTDDEEVRADLLELREMLLALNQQQSNSREAMMQQAQAMLQEVLQSPNPDEKLREYAEAIDETFLSMLAANIQQAEQKNATFAVKRLRSIYDAAMRILQEGMPDDIRLLNQILMAEDEASVRALLKENRALLTPEFVASLRELEERFRQEDSAEMADRIKAVRAQVSLMM
ncbi:MAG: hypothetical protein KDD84_02650 [Caldilineaceae bacterium]|nr:hypothetical protein [Caldilineaceae bacterium]